MSTVVWPRAAVPRQQPCAIFAGSGMRCARCRRLVLRSALMALVLCAAGFGTAIPEDLYHLIKKAVSVRKHLERNRKDRDSKFRLILIESRIHRLARYYRLAKKLPANWK